MRSVLFYLSFILCIAFVSCEREEIQTEEITSGEAPLTDDSIAVKNLTLEKNNAPRRGEFHLLGYGYDVTGEYSDSSAVRGSVVDIAKLQRLQPTRVVVGKHTSTETNIMTTNNAEELARQISMDVMDLRFFNMNEQERKKYFKGEINTYFSDNNPFKSKYIYGRSCEKRTIGFLSFNYGSLDSILTPSFGSDIQTKTPSEIIRKYGTHVLTRINIGSKFTVMYQSETTNPDWEKAAQQGFTIALAKTFGSFSGYLDYSNSKSAPGNYAQKISFKASGGDPSLIKVTVDPVTKVTTVDHREWIKLFKNEQAELVNIQNVQPIYEFVSDPVKQKEVKSYFDEYLSANAAILVR
ncbi:MAC/perforin domain-containing protein [Desertivirga brevis]|uniref:MAC/perforin domain-containing protein n=1 Tax=Desertivirga brevis TaxID=2810310 RepID=UPI001A95EAD0|nr:MAC/perforin domain-containing protein [Pedobacter sp. SYSU D00873]